MSHHGYDYEKCVVPSQVKHSVVYHNKAKWAAVPANNGGNSPIWQWDNEILIGFTVGVFENAEFGHQCDYGYPFESWLARSTRGGETWTAWKPDHYVGQSRIPLDPPGDIDFAQSGFVMRIEGTGYHGNQGPCWFYSEDRGKEWRGPFSFANLMAHPELKGKEFTSRTAYIVNGSHESYLFMTVRERRAADRLSVVLEEKAFLARTIDGGRSFSFVSWVVPWTDPFRAAMPSPVRLSKSMIVVAIRRKSPSNNWIDCYETLDNGMSWSFLSKVGDTEHGNVSNGNPPALIKLNDGRLCCAYGNRSDKCMVAKYSEDEGKTWTIGLTLRNDFHSANGFPDLGYPRLFQRSDSKLVVVYFWCNESRPQTHIEATVFNAIDRSGKRIL